MAVPGLMDASALPAPRSSPARSLAMFTSAATETQLVCRAHFVSGEIGSVCSAAKKSVADAE